MQDLSQAKARSWFQIHASSDCDGHAKITCENCSKILEISLARSFKNLAIELCKILAKIRQGLGSIYTQDLIVTIMQDHISRSCKFFLLVP